MSADKKAPPGRGEAGHCGEGVRSDLFAAVELADSGGIQVNLTSTVGKLYGKSIHQTAEKVMADLGVENAVVEIDDSGALPFILTARIEAAARAAGVSRENKALPDTTLATRERTARDALRRSRLYLPGSQPKFMVNAGLHCSDAVILDLEDSVHPNDKPAARLLVRNALHCIDFMGAERMVRINQLPLGLEDLDDIVPESPDLILIPKVERADEVVQVAARIAQVQEKAGGGEPIWIMPILESALGIESAFEIAVATNRVVALTIGLEDYTADLGVPKTFAGNESLYARTRMVNAAKAAGVQAIAPMGHCVAGSRLRRNGLHPSAADPGHPRRVRADPGGDRQGTQDRRGVRGCAGQGAWRGEPRQQDGRPSGRTARPAPRRRGTPHRVDLRRNGRQWWRTGCREWR